MEEMRRLFKRFFSFENNYFEKKDILIFGGQAVGIGASADLLIWNTDKREGAITGFNFGFSNFIPAAGSYIFTLKMNNAIIPQTDSGAVFQYSEFLNEDIDFFKAFDLSGTHVIKASITNNGAAVIYPRITIKGFYTT